MVTPVSCCGEPRSTVMYTLVVQSSRSAVGELPHSPGVCTMSTKPPGSPRSSTPGPDVTETPGSWSMLAWVSQAILQPEQVWMPALVWLVTRSSKQMAPWSIAAVQVRSTPAVPSGSYGGGLLSGQSKMLASVPSHVRKPATIGRVGSEAVAP